MSTARQDPRPATSRRARRGHRWGLQSLMALIAVVALGFGAIDLWRRSSEYEKRANEHFTKAAGWRMIGINLRAQADSIREARHEPESPRTNEPDSHLVMADFARANEAKHDRLGRTFDELSRRPWRRPPRLSDEFSDPFPGRTPSAPQ